MGQIRGRIVEAATDAPVPGATVTVTSRNLGDPRVVTTDENGEYLVPSLPIGVYKVTVSYPGIKPVAREILVQPGVTSPVDITWSAELAAEAETTTVVEERPVTNSGSTQTGTVVSPEQMRYIPAANRRFTDEMLLVPGVTRGGTSFNFVKGGRSSDNRYLIDGLDITDPVTRLPSQRLAQESIEAVQVITGGFDAEYNVVAGIVNTITREGTDEWHGGVSVYGTNASLDNRIPQGLMVYERDKVFNTDPIAATYTYINTVYLGGPIIKHRLWFNFTFEYRYNPVGKIPGPPLNLPSARGIVNTYLPRFKLSWAPSWRQRLGLSLATDPEPARNQDAGQTRLGIYQNATNQAALNAIFTWSVFLSPNFEFRLDAGIKHHNVENGPQGYFASVDTSYCNLFSARNCAYDRDAPAHLNGDDGSVWYNATADYNNTSNTNIQFDPKITWRGRLLGEHNAKLGVQFLYLRNHTYQHRPGNLQYSDRGGGSLEDGVCDPDIGKTAGCFQRTFREDRDFSVRGVSPALFLQDHWRVLSWLILTPGIRFDYGQSRLSDGRIFHSQFAVGPRMGLIADLTRDQKTIFSTSYGRSNDVSQIEQARNYQISLVQNETTERWNGQTWVFQSASGGDTGAIIDKKAKVTHADQITTSIRREILRNTVVAVEHTYRKLSNIWTTVETNVIWDPTGYRIVDYLDGTQHTTTVYTAPDGAYQTYQGVTLWLEGRPTHNWYFFTAYTLSWLFGTYSDGNLFRIPQQFKFAWGFLPNDNRHMVQAAASYRIHGLTIGPRLEYFSGGPRNKFFSGLDAGSNNRRSPRGTNPGTCSGNVPGQGNFSPATTVCDNNIGLIAEYREPPRVQVDLHLEYDFYQLLRQHIALNCEFLNIFNDRSATSLQESDGASGNFGQVTGRNTGLQVRFGARFDF